MHDSTTACSSTMKSQDENPRQVILLNQKVPRIIQGAGFSEWEQQMHRSSPGARSTTPRRVIALLPPIADIKPPGAISSCNNLPFSFLAILISPTTSSPTEQALGCHRLTSGHSPHIHLPHLHSDPHQPTPCLPTRVRSRNSKNPTIK